MRIWRAVKVLLPQFKVTWQPSLNFMVFQWHLPRLLKDHRGEYACIVGGRLRKVDGNLDDLLDWAYENYPDRDGLLQPIEKDLKIIGR